MMGEDTEPGAVAPAIDAPCVRGAPVQRTGAQRGVKAGCARVPWSKARKATFLDHLAATCNVSAAAEAAGVLTGSVYQLRRRDAGFRAGWGEALQAGYEMLELQLVGHALAGGGTRSITNGDVANTGAIDVDLALKLLGTHRGAMLGKPFKGGARPKTATAAETNAALLKRLRRVNADRAARGVQQLALPAPARADTDVDADAVAGADAVMTVEP